MFSILINDLFFFIKHVYFSNFACDNTVYTARNSTEELIKVLETESKSAIGWFKMKGGGGGGGGGGGMILICDKKRKQI